MTETTATLGPIDIGEKPVARLTAPPIIRSARLILRDGPWPGLTAKESFLAEGLPSTTIKFAINQYDFYIHAAFFNKQVDFLAMTLSGVHEHNIRALIEVTQRMATHSLRHGSYTLEELCELWIAYDFDPWGVCPQLAAYGYESLSVKSPIDAAAKILKARFS